MKQGHHIKLRQLECFVEIARQQSVTRAAQVLHLTQPAVTRSLRELESAIGVALTERQGRGIKLTGFGEIYVRYAGESLAALRRGGAAVKDLVAFESPPLRIGALPTVSARLMPKAMALYLKSPAKAALSISTGENQVLLQQLRQGELDIVIGRLPAPDLMQGLKFEPLYTEPVVFVVQKDHPLRQKPILTVEDFEEYPLLLPSKNSIIRPYVDRLFIEQGMSPTTSVIETVCDSFGRAFTRDYQAIWVISAGVVAAELSSGIFQTLPIDTQTTLGAVGLNQLVNQKASPGLQILTDILRNLASTPQFEDTKG